MEIENNESKQLSRLHTITPLSKYLAMGLLIALPFVGGWIGYIYAPVKVVEVERVVVIEEVAESLQAVQRVEIINGDARVLFFDGSSEIVAQGIAAEETEDIQTIQNFLEASISPDGQYVAIQGVGFEDYFVQVYNVHKQRLEEKVWGQIVRWTDDGRLEMNACNLAGEECQALISVSAETPWLMVEVNQRR